VLKQLLNQLRPKLSSPAVDGPGTGEARRVLDVGGGSKAVELPLHYRDWTRLLLDIDPRTGADLVCDARTLVDQPPQTRFDAIHCAHNLEHYYRHDVDKVLRGFLHVLKDEGFAQIRVPDIGGLIQLMADNNLDIEQEIFKAHEGAITAHDVLYGYAPEIEASGQDFYAHKTGFTRASLLRALYSNGFGEVYFAPSLSAPELHAFAFKTAATAAQRLALGLPDPVPAGPDERAPLPARPGIYSAGATTSPDEVEALYQRAVAASNDGDLAAAIALTQQAISREPGLAPLHYLLGCCLEEQEQCEAAAQAFADCLNLKPAYPLDAEAAAHRALCRARLDLQNGSLAPSASLPLTGSRSVSVIVCSVNARRFAETAGMYRQLLAGLEHEIIGIHDATSLAGGYNRGLHAARGDIVVFAHDDARILSPDFAARLLGALERHDVVGVAGSRSLLGGAWHFAGHPHVCGQIAMPGDDSGRIVTLYDVSRPESAGLQVLDGVFLAARRETALRVGFDEARFDGWHLYDVDFSYRAAQMGLDCATCNNLLLVHASQGGYNEDWLKYSQRFVDKHKDTVAPMQALFYKPQLVSLSVRSVEEWRLLTEHLMNPDPRK
jgi:tetratricopeptide (TPR) repeat protein